MAINRKLTIIMYHYVRNIEHSRYPKIRGLEISRFKAQLNYLEEHYTFISIAELIHAIEKGSSLPQKAILLTFNDNYLDHFTNVFPILDERGIQGCFYPEVAAIQGQEVLMNHKIHFILASAENEKEIVDQIYTNLDELRDQYHLKSNQFYFNKLATASSYDPREIIFIKRLLQTELDEEVSQIITDNLFRYFVDIPEKRLRKELYLDEKHIKCMVDNGMHFGILGYNHRRYNTLSREEQINEIHSAREFLLEIGVDERTITASYPWGAYNNDTLNILRRIDCKAAFTTEPKISDLDVHPHLELPRLDTNEFPTEKESGVNKWLQAG